MRVSEGTREMPVKKTTTAAENGKSKSLESWIWVDNRIFREGYSKISFPFNGLHDLAELLIVWQTEDQPSQIVHRAETKNHDYNFSLGASVHTRDAEARKGQPLITQSMINRVMFALPPCEKSDDLAQAFENRDIRIAYLKANRDELQDTFRTFLHKLMTATTRISTITFSPAI